MLVKNGFATKDTQETERILNPTAKPFAVISKPKAPSLDLPVFGKKPLGQWSNGASRFNHHNPEQDEAPFESPILDDQEYRWQTASTVKQLTEHLTDNNDKKTLLIKNLPLDVSIKDVVNLMRGGALIDVWVKRHDRHAHVSFVEAEAAYAFVKFAQRKDIYLHGKRVRF